MNAILMAAELTPGSVAALVFVAVVTWMLLLRAHRARRSRPNEPLPSAQARQADRAAASRATLSTDLERWEVRMFDLSRELSGQLDSKISAVQHLIVLADQRIGELQALLQRHDSAAKNDPAGTQAERLAPTDPSLADNPPNTQGRQQQIFRLADEGHDSRAIAAQVKLPVGEVELILGLRQSQRP